MPLPTIDPAIQYSIFNAVTSVVITAMAAIQVKHKEEMLILQEMIEKFLLFKESASFILPPKPKRL